MLRSTFFAMGLFVALWGISFLMVDKIVLTLRDSAPKNPQIRGLFLTSGPDRKQVLDPPDWAAFSLMSIGAVTMLYSVALPRKNG
jgi:hypothetical protein